MPDLAAAEVPDQVATVPEMDVAGVGIAEVVTPLVAGTAVASATQSMVAEPQSAAVTTSPSGIAMGSIGKSPTLPAPSPPK